MPIATVQLPNGKIADIEIPQGATPQEIESFVMSQPEFAQQTSEAPQQPIQPEQSNLPQESFQEANRRRVGQFAMGLPNAFGNALIGGVQAGADLGDKAVRMIDQIYFGDSLSGQKLFGERLAEQVKKRKEEQAQLPAAERAGIKIGELIPYATMGASTGAKVATATGSKIAGLIAGGAVGGGEMTALSPQEEAGLGNRVVETAKGAATGAAFGAGLGVGGKAVQLAGQGAAKLGEDIIKGYKARPVEAVAGFTNKPVETLDAVAQAIKDKSSNLYTQMREAGANIRPSATGTIFKEIDNALNESGIMNARLHGDTLGIVSDLKDLAKGKKGNIGLEELDQYRQLLGDVVKKNTDVAGKLNADGLKANIAIDKLDDVVENLKPNYLVESGDPKAVELLNQARDEWKRYRKFDSISNIVRKADGDPNRIKTLMQNFVNNPKNLRGFTSVEKDALRNASRNSNSEGLLKAVGKFGFDLGSGRNIGNAALPVGSILVGGGTGGMLATVGTVARQAQKLSARGKVEDVLKLIQGQEPKVASKAIQQLSPKTRDFVITNILTKTATQ